MRFTLKTMMIAMVVASFIFTVFFALPSIIAVVALGLLWIFAPPAMIAGLVYGRGYGRAFCVGCIATGGCMPFVYFYLLMAAFSGFDDFDQLTDDGTVVYLKLFTGIMFVLIGLSGLMAMAVRWFSLRMAASAQPNNTSGQVPYSVIHGRVMAGSLIADTRVAEPVVDGGAMHKRAKEGFT